MNYIKSLQSENNSLKAKISQLSNYFDDYLAFLHGPKFTGTENGERKDWIATGDVIQTIRELKNVCVLEN